MARVRLVAAMSADRVIGRADGLPWDVPTDYAHFVGCAFRHFARIAPDRS